MNKTEISLVVAGLVILALLFAGCVETQKIPVWGKGELSADWLKYFPDDNPSRLNKAQNDMLNKHNAVIHGLNKVEDGNSVHYNGLVDIVNNLDSRVKVLEAVDPNALEPRINALEEKRFIKYKEAEGAESLIIRDGITYVYNGYKWVRQSDILNEGIYDVDGNIIGQTLAAPLPNSNIKFENRIDRINGGLEDNKNGK